MKTAVVTKEHTLWRSPALPKAGVFVGLSADGCPMVEYSGNKPGPVLARTAISTADPGDTVLLLFEDGDPARPIIIGVVRDRFEPRFPQQVKITGKEIFLEGAETVSLCSGESTLTLRKDGRATLKGREVLTRASRTNRVRGATVKIN
jgi:hypothetical protein